ncbi:hypothetical protein EDB87DRAFT_1570934, partial [Lactarius vividus]
ATFAMANVQAALGISMQLCLVPVLLTTTLQAGNVALLSAVLQCSWHYIGQTPLCARRQVNVARGERLLHLPSLVKEDSFFSYMIRPIVI